MRHSAYLPAEGTAWTANQIFRAMSTEKNDSLPEGKLLFLGQSSYAQKPTYWESEDGHIWQVWPAWMVSGYLRGCARQISREDIPQSALA